MRGESVGRELLDGVSPQTNMVEYNFPCCECSEQNLWVVGREYQIEDAGRGFDGCHFMPAGVISCMRRRGAEGLQSRPHLLTDFVYSSCNHFGISPDLSFHILDPKNRNTTLLLNRPGIVRIIITAPHREHSRVMSVEYDDTGWFVQLMRQEALWGDKR